MPRKSYKEKQKSAKLAITQSDQQQKSKNELSPQEDELLGEIIDGINNEELEICTFLMQDENEVNIKRLVECLYDPSCKGNFRKYVKAQRLEEIEKSYKNEIWSIWENIQKGKESKLQMEKHEDNIRKINQNYYANDRRESEDQLQELSWGENKKTILQQAIQTRWDCIYYGNVKCLMIAYGDLYPIEETIKFMHSQVQLFYKIIVGTLLKGERCIGALMKIDKSVLSVKSKTDLLRYIKKLCPEDVKDFNDISKIYKKVKRKAKLKDDDLLEEEIISQKDESFDEDSSMNENSNEIQPDDAQLQGHLRTKNLQQIQYFVDLTQHMTPIQYKRYSQCRIINLLQPKSSKNARSKLAEFIDPEGILNSKIIDTKMLELFSFIGCRFIKRIIFGIIRGEDKQEGKLKKLGRPLAKDEVMGVGNRLLQEYVKKVKEMIEEQNNRGKEAYNLFMKEVSSEKIIREIIPKKILEKYGDEYKKLWEQNNHYQKCWAQRVEAEKEIDYIVKQVSKRAKESSTGLQNKEFYDKFLQEMEEIDSANIYCQFFIKNIQTFWDSFYQHLEEGSLKSKQMIFRKYLTGQSFQADNKTSKSHLGEVVRKPRKKLKLESLQS